QRVHEREGGVYSEVLAQTEERDRRDHARYLKLYSIDINDFNFADTIIDAEANNQHQIADIITRMVHEKIGI
ncbi:MAG: cytidylate kinase, partial [Spirochaetales bacterium]|nr:cytidylate kinase [Spirochaetales bacterium]